MSGGPSGMDLLICSPMFKIMLLYDGSGHMHAKSAGKCPSKENSYLK